MKAFTMLETLLVLAMISILTFLSLKIQNASHLSRVENELSAKNLAAQITYLKSQAIKDHTSIMLIINRGSDQIKVANTDHQVKYIKIANGVIENNRNMDSVIIDSNGELNHFGSVYIRIDQTLFRFIFHIEKGSLRIEKQN
ncbi:type II secretion system GspH family protein [Staphylococcus simulans]|uniref:competence type IV pilus minor pilin ComGD n=1 Tax=Staphylococcus simulans TaxID=1286 RepID=UPI001E4F39AB|nr:competence type IV pilus minor pilin ComGD [Staphylococcus simulans]MCD8915035.1 type II secretion system GspH family protein [Staphylococcus simulans]